jgi:DNA-binding IclR family transcriptional regulator
MSEKKYIQSLQRAARIMRLVEERASMKLVEICQETGLKKSTVFGLVQTLEYEGYLTKASNGFQYSLGLTALQLGLAYMKDTEIDKMVHELLVRLVAEVDETAYFIMRVGSQYHYLDYVLSSQPLKVVPGEGRFIDLPDHSAVGQVFEKYKEAGFQFAKDLEGVFEGTNCFAAPYKNGDQAIGCVVLTGPSYRYTEERMEATMDVYKKIMLEMGLESHL